jgi:hypothetical protein
MVAFNKIDSFVEALAEKVHNLGSDQLKVAITNSAPSASNTILANLTEITYTNLSTRNVVTISSSQTTGTYTLVLTDLVLTASGSVGPLRYIVLYNDTAASDELIGWWDYGSSISLASGETLTVDFAASTITLA